MEIVKPGREMVNVCYGTCRRCGCEIRCTLDEADLRKVEIDWCATGPVYDEVLAADCPNPGCGETIWLNRSDRDY